MTDVYQRLAKKLNELPHGFPPTESGVELRILRKIFTPEDSEIALKIRPVPETAQQIATRLGKPLEEMQGILDDMVGKGQIGSAKMGGAQMYMLFPFLIGIWEFQVLRLDKELADLMEEYAPALVGTLGGFSPSLARVIPVNAQISGQHQVYPYEDLRQIMDKAKSFQLMDCICRKEQAIQGRPCTHTLENCLAFSEHEGAFDKYTRGRLISRDEAVAVLAESEEEGLVHCTYNVQAGQMFVCNCCSCCCGILRSVKELSSPYMLAGSNFFAAIDQDTCEACGICANERCPMDAIVEDDGAYIVQPERCIGCGVCTTTCPSEAVTLIRKPDTDIDQPPSNIMDWYFKRAGNRGVKIPIE